MISVTINSPAVHRFRHQVGHNHYPNHPRSRSTCADCRIAVVAVYLLPAKLSTLGIPVAICIIPIVNDAIAVIIQPITILVSTQSAMPSISASPKSSSTIPSPSLSMPSHSSVSVHRKSRRYPHRSSLHQQYRCCHPHRCRLAAPGAMLGFASSHRRLLGRHHRSPRLHTSAIDGYLRLCRPHPRTSVVKRVRASRCARVI